MKLKLNLATQTKILFTALALLALSISAIAQQKKASSTREEFIEVEKNVLLHVTDWGTGKAVVLIHGWPLSDAMYEYQYQELVEKGYRVIGITLRGFGKSDKPYGKYDYDVFANDIKVVLDKLNIQNATLGGFSMGGAIAIHYVAKYNSAHVNKLALFGAAAPLWTKRNDYSYGFSKEDVNGLIALSKTNRPQLLENFGKIFAANETALSQGIGNWLGGINLEASPYATTQCLIALRDTDLRAELSKINIPTAIFHGTKDKICEFALAEQMQKGIKNSYIVKFENSGHGLFIEELGKFNSELIKFLEK
ncbi:pimeloyl-ACP methyl ester carboxylesterase [Flavobacterium sp. 1]|uniref:alpha/beta fold hydrolase n=1 Tax=Flavobacterium sp. 1 TaxID=2035200 RepID=UPI000C236EDB|nr:alpha/beta hydrolase [Flavobacterium sp. 1]PJJ08381.1 pimeloyl-ACP methyl ester carboxylesterase [Flavobacterium sp. 1]